MSRKSDPNNPLVKVTLNLYAADWEKMHALYPTIGASVATRLLIQAHVAKIAAATAERVAGVPDLDVEIEINDDADVENAGD